MFSNIQAKRVSLYNAMYQREIILTLRQGYIVLDNGVKKYISK